MSKLLTLILILFSINSCQKKEHNFSDAMIEKLIVETNEIPSQYGFDLYLKTVDNRIFLTDNNYLFRMYQKHYKKDFPTFKAFLNEVLNNNYVISKPKVKNLVINSFKLNSKVKEEYAKFGFEPFFNEYTTKLKSGKIELKKSVISDDEYLTVAYLFYLNKFDISRNCYIGSDYIISREASFR